MSQHRWEKLGNVTAETCPHCGLVALRTGTGAVFYFTQLVGAATACSSRWHDQPDEDTEPPSKLAPE